MASLDSICCECKFFTFPKETFMVWFEIDIYHCKRYLVKMNTSAWLLQFQGSLNSLVV